MSRSYTLFAYLIMIGMGFVTAGCASTEAQKEAGLYEQEIADPFEEANRTVFAFNKVVDEAVIYPVLEGYRVAVPKPARSGVRNFLINLKSPVRFVNQLLQGDVDGAGNELFRTTVNTLVGAGGIFDVAGHEGYEFEQEDFGQTLGVWGVGHGPYLVVPIIGPSSLRDYAGYAIDSFADPLRWYLFNTDHEGLYYAKAGAEYLDLRESLMDVLKELEASSIDYYAAVRSTYAQRRSALVNDENGSYSNSTMTIPVYDDY